jgi:sterol 24-C-methyltransferase
MSFSERIYLTRTQLAALWKLYRLSPEQVQNYRAAFEIFSREWNEQEYDENVRKSIVDYYTVMNQICAMWQLEKMYIPPAIDLSKTMIENQNLFEEKMARALGLKHGDRALEFGCGRGRISAHIARYSGAKINGINIDAGQVESAKQYAQRNGLSHLCRFQTGDINNLPFLFPDNTFDATYHVQVFTYAKNLPALFHEIYRVTKPGGRFACMDYVLKEGFDEHNPLHVELVKRTKPLIGAIGSPKVAEYVAALESAGFKVTVSEDASLDGNQTALINKASDHYGNVEKWVKRLIKWHLVPKHLPLVFEPLAACGDAFVKADAMHILTTSWYIVAEKPRAR